MLLSRCMQAAGPQCSGILFDRPMVLERCVRSQCVRSHALSCEHAQRSVDVQRTFVDHGVAAARLQLVAGDVRDPMPAAAQHASPDTIVMKHFLSAFSDPDVSRILEHCKRVLAPGGTVLLLQVGGPPFFYTSQMETTPMSTLHCRRWLPRRATRRTTPAWMAWLLAFLPSRSLRSAQGGPGAPSVSGRRCLQLLGFDWAAATPSAATCTAWRLCCSDCRKLFLNSMLLHGYCGCC